MRLRCSRNFFYTVFSGVLWAVPLWAKTSIVKQSIAAFEREALSEARACIDKAMEETTHQTQGDAWYYRGVIYEKILRDQVATEEADQLFEETLNAYRKALTLTSQASQYHSFARINLDRLWMYYLNRGRRYYKQEAFGNAVQQFRYCKEIIPHHPDAYLYTAIAAHQAGEYDLALHNYTHYLELGVAASAVVYRGLAHLTAYPLKAPEKALKILETALSQYPFDNDLLYEQVQIYTALGQSEEKQELVKKQIAATPSKAAIHYQLGYWYEQQGHWREALKQYQKAAELAPNSAEPVRQQGMVHYNQAVQNRQEITAMNEEEFQQVGAERIEILENHLRQALPCFEQANKKSPRDPLILKHLQIIYRRLHKPTQAKRTERCLRKHKLSGSTVL
jgi:tetratricopeptide (TPR) repeat protein